jgi:hypothetical protein
MRRYPKVGELKVLESAAGFYIGRLYHETEDDSEPYDRASGYYRDKESAEMDLINGEWIENLN